MTIDKAVILAQNMDVGEFFYTLLYILGYRMADLEDEMLKRGTAKFEMGKVVPSLLSIEKAKRVMLLCQ